MLATALAHAFLAAQDWSKPALVDSAASVLGARRRWLGPLADHVLGNYHRRPDDAARELAAVVLDSESLSGRPLRKAAKRGKPITVAHYAVRPAAARDGRVPRLDTLAGLAEMLGLGLGELEWFCRSPAVEPHRRQQAAAALQVSVAQPARAGAQAAGNSAPAAARTAAYGPA